MKVFASVIALVAACTDPQVGQVRQDLAAQDCVGVGNYPKAVMPDKIPIWDGSKPPGPGTNGSYVGYDLGTGYYLFALADPVKGVVPWAVYVEQGKVGAIMAYVSAEGQLDVPRVPPRPPPGGNRAQALLEYTLRAQPQWGYAIDAVVPQK